VIDFIHVETKTELVSAIYMTNTNQYVPQVLYSVKVQDLNKGDIVSLTSAYELTTSYNFDVMISSNVSISPFNPTVYGDILDESRGYNINYSTHHGVTNHLRQVKLNKDYPGINYINTVVWSASTAAKPNMQDSLYVEKGHGHLDVIIYKKI